MGRQFSLVISCRHDRPGMIIQTQDGEHVCSCGVVLEERTPEPPAERPESRASLYHQVEHGGLPVELPSSRRRIHVYRAASSEFSSVCGKLGMPDFSQRRAWDIFRALRGSTDHTRAKCASFAVYVACREAGQPVSEGQIRDAVCSSLCVRAVPTMLGIISELHEDAAALGIDSNKRHSDEYYVNTETSRRQPLFRTGALYDRFKAITRANFAGLEGNPQNRARRAACLAMREMGVCA